MLIKYFMSSVTVRGGITIQLINRVSRVGNNRQHFNTRNMLDSMVYFYSKNNGQESTFLISILFPSSICYLCYPPKNLPRPLSQPTSRSLARETSESADGRDQADGLSKQERDVDNDEVKGIVNYRRECQPLLCKKATYVN